MPSATKLKNQNQILTFISLLFLIISLLLGLQLVRQRQLINKKASTPSGTVNLSLSGPSSTVPGQNLPVNINLDILSSPNDKGITGASLSFTYPTTATVGTPEIVGTLPSPWTYPIKEFTTNGSTSTITLSALYFQQDISGYLHSGPFTFATLNFPTLSEGNLALTYDAANSYIYSKDDPSGSQTSIDILNSSPTSNTFTIALAPTLTPTPSNTTVPSATPTKIPATSSIDNFGFNPPNITIYTGDSVTWANNDPVPHTVTSDTGVWDSGNLAPGQTYSHAFPAAGTFPYHCTLHTIMTGTVTVLARPTATPTPTLVPGAAEPNSCGGTCGTNLNCKSGLACYFDAALKQKVCRNPLDFQSTTCVVRKATPAPTKKSASGATPTRVIPQDNTRAAATPVYYDYPTPTLFLEPLPTISDALPSQPSSTPGLTRVVMVAGMWILVILLIIWLIKKYQDHKSQEKTVSELVNRFKTPEPPTPSK